MRFMIAAALLATSACGSYRLEPAQGLSLRYSFCGSALPSDVRVFSRNAPCPDLAKIQQYAETVEQRYDVKLSGARLYVTSAMIECGEGLHAFGCTVGDEATITNHVYLGVLVRHELSHVAVNRRGGDTLEHWYIDHPEERSGLRRHTGGDAP